MMKLYSVKMIVLGIMLGMSATLLSQNIAINLSGTPSPNPTAILDLSDASNGQLGMLLPNVSITSASAITPFTLTPTTGLIVWNTNAAMVGGFGVGFYYWNGTQWNYIENSGGASTGWGTTGNAGTNPAVNYAGTSDPQPFIIKTQATERMRFLASGKAGVGTATPQSAMDVNGNMSLGTYAGVNAAPANGMIVSGQVGIGTNVPNASAALDITSTSTGFLPPRMTGVQMAAIAAPAVGLMVLNSTTNCMEYWNGTAWQNVVCPCTGPPATPGLITGNTTPCASSSGNVYTIAAVANATSYNWTLPAGATITAGAGTTSITVTFGTTSGNITVTAINSCGTSGASTLAVTLNTPPTAPAVPSGTTSPSKSTANVYTIATVAGATSYTWSTSNTNLATVTLGQGTTSATITSTATTGTYNICVYASNACGNSASSCLTVTSISCTVTHSTQTWSYSTNTIYTWTVPCGITQITITARGAQGGNPSSGGANGAVITGTFTVTTGNILDIIAGQQPTFVNEGPGGGGSFVWNTSTSNTLMVAAGGGGGGYGGSAGGVGSATATTTVGGGIAESNSGGVGGNGGSGGLPYPSYGYAAGGAGAGWNSNGASGANGTASPYFGGGGGFSPLNGANGGSANGNTCGDSYAGGWGGGGASACYGSGGGGGYNGGGGANAFGYPGGGSGYNGGGGGGGGSFNGGTAPTNTAGANAGTGSVTITW